MLKDKKPFPISYIWFCMVVILINGRLWAQSPPPFKKGTDTAGIHKLITMARLTANPDSAIRILQQTAQKSIEGDFYLGASSSYFSIALRYNSRNNYQQAIAYCNKALPYAEKSGNKSQVTNCYALLGGIDFMQGNYTRASEQLFKALGDPNHTDSGEAVINIYVDLSRISTRLGNKANALHYLSVAESIVRHRKSDTLLTNMLLADVLHAKGTYYIHSDNPDSAVICFMEVLRVSQHLGPGKENVRIYLQGMAEASLGQVYTIKGDYEKAIFYCKESIALTRGKYANMAISSYFNLGEALEHLKRYKEAESVVLSALKEATKANIKDQAADMYGILCNIYKDEKEYKKALDCMDTIMAIKDTLVTIQKAKAISQVEAKYNVAEKDRQIALNELLIARQQNNITRKNIWIGSISGGVCTLGLLSIGLYRNRNLRQESLIKSLKQQNTIGILKGVVQGEENERIRLARDLHDGIGGMLSATKMRFMALRHENETLVGSPRYLEAMGLLDIMGDEIRKTSHNLMPEVLLKQNLVEALRTYCNNIQAGSDLQIDFQGIGNFDELPNDLKLNIYRIVQELLKNIIQHAKASYSLVQIMMLESYLTVSVEDNGTGFDTAETKDGIGLHNLKTRVLSHEGHYTLKSEPGKGTTVYIEFGIPGTNKA